VVELGKTRGEMEMSGLSDKKIKEICEGNNVTDENLIKAISEVIAENNKLLEKQIPDSIFKTLNKGLRQ